MPLMGKQTSSKRTSLTPVHSRRAETIVNAFPEKGMVHTSRSKVFQKSKCSTQEVGAPRLPQTWLCTSNVDGAPHHHVAERKHLRRALQRANTFGAGLNHVDHISTLVLYTLAAS